MRVRGGGGLIQSAVDSVVGASEVSADLAVGGSRLAADLVVGVGGSGGLGSQRKREEVRGAANCKQSRLWSLEVIDQLI